MRTKIGVILMILRDSRGDTGVRVLLPYCAPGQLRPVVLRDKYISQKRG